MGVVHGKGVHGVVVNTWCSAIYILCFYIFGSIIYLSYYDIDFSYYDIDFSYYDIDLSYHDILVTLNWHRYVMKC